MPTRFALLVALAVAGAAGAQEAATPEIVGADSVPFLAEFKAKGIPATTGIRWSVTPKAPGLTLRRVPHERVMIVAGPPGTYEITMEMFSAKLDGKGGLDVIVELGEITKAFTITGTAPGPGPGPPPPPPPPGPVDPLTQALRDAAKKDGWSGSRLADYAVGFNSLATANIKYATVSAISTAQLNTLSRALGDGVHVPENVRAIIKAELDAALPPGPPTRALTDAELASVQKCWARLAVSLERASK